MEKTGYDQFMNSGETWYYRYEFDHTEVEGMSWDLNYTALRDTNIWLNGEEVDAKILSEHYVFENTIAGAEQRVDSTAEIVFYYLNGFQFFVQTQNHRHQNRWGL